MTRIERVRTVAEKHGATLAEYLLLHIAAAFAMTEQEAAVFCSGALSKSNHANTDCHKALQSCLQKGWVVLSPAGRVTLTKTGMAVAHPIADELMKSETD